MEAISRRVPVKAAPPTTPPPSPAASCPTAPAPALSARTIPAPAAAPAPDASKADDFGAAQQEISAEIVKAMQSAELPAPSDENPKGVMKAGEFVEGYPTLTAHTTMTAAAAAAVVEKRIRAEFKPILDSLTPILEAHQKSAAEAAREGLIGALLKPGADGNPLVPEAREIPGDAAFWTLIDGKAPAVIKQAADSTDPESVAFAVEWARKHGWSAPSARAKARAGARAADADLGAGNLRGGAGAPDEAAISLRKEFAEDKDED